MPNWKKVLVSGSDASLNSLLVSTATTSSTLQVNGDSDFNGKVEIYNSGSTVFDVQGSQGQLFSITDSLSGSLFSVNDISGIPILEVFSDETVKLGTFGDEAIIVNGNETTTKNLTVDGDISSSGDLYLDGGIYDNNDTLGTADQVLFTTSTGIEWRDNIAQEAQDLVITGKNLSGDTIAKGTPLYFTGSGTQGNIIGIYPADAGNPNRMPAGGVAGEQIADDEEGSVYIYGFIAGVDTSQFNAGDSVFVGVGGGYTNQKPTGSALIQKLGNVEKVNQNNGSGVIQGPSWYNDLPNWEEGKVKVGRDDGQPVTSSVIHLDETNGRMGVGTTSPTAKLHIEGGTGLSSLSVNDTFLIVGDVDSLNLAIDDNEIQVRNNGLESALLLQKNGGNVGIGITSPTNKLHIYYNSTQGSPESHTPTGATLHIQDSSNSLYLDGNSIIGTGAGALHIGNQSNTPMNLWTNGLNRLHITAGGNIGIGTDTPENKLHLLTTTTNSAQQLLIQNGSTGDAAIKFNISGDTYSLGIDNSDGDKFKLSAGDLGTNDRIVINSSGNVGIGTTSPSNTLHVFKDATIGAITSTNVANAGLHIQDVGANMYMDGNSIVMDVNGYLTTNGAYYFQIGTNNTPRIHVDSDGNVGIATITPTGVLNVEGNNGTWRVNSYGNTLFNNTTDTGNLWTIHPRSNGYLSFGYSAATNLNGTDQDEYFSTTYDLITIEGSTGNVGIGTTSPANKLDVNGGIDADTLNTGQGDNELYAMNQNVQTTDSVTFAGLTVNGNGTVNGDLTITGKVTAEEFHTEFVSASIIYQSGSTKFGDTQDDNHNFTGSVNITDSLSVNGSSVLTTADEGSGNGLDADTLDGQEGSYYLDFNNHTNKPTLISGSAEGDNQGQIKLNGVNVNTNNLGTDDSPSFAGLTVDTNTLYVDSSNNRVGIGTATPGGILDVWGDENSNSILKITGSPNNIDDLILLGDVDNVGNSQLFTIDGSTPKFTFTGGNVGIGTITPSKTLTVSGDISASGDLFVDDFARIDALRIGTTSTDPGDGNLYVENRIEIARESSTIGGSSANAANGILQLGDTSGAFIVFDTNEIQQFGTSINIRGEEGINLWTGDAADSDSSQVFNILKNGNVGIGTTSPSAKLHTTGVGYFSGGTISFTDTVTNAGIVIDEEDYIYTKDNLNLRKLIGKSLDVIHIGQSGTSLIDEIRLLPGNSGIVTVYDNTAEVARFTGGNVGIGTTSPTQPLTVEGNISGSGNLDIDGNTTIDGNLTINGNTTLGNAGSDTLRIYSSDVELNKASAGTNHTIKNTNAASDLILETTSDLILSPTNNVGIGTTTPSQPLTVVGNISGSGDINIDGDGYVDGTLTAGRVVETSTRELKENIQPLESQKEVVDSLQPVSYTWKEGGEKDFGLIAEDVAEIAPDLVSYDEEGKLKGIKYSKLSVLLLDVVKKQNSVIEELSERITKLETNGRK